MVKKRLHWSEKFSVCCEKIDKQHKNLFKTINELGEEKAESDPQEYARLLSCLTDYFKQHFEAEEYYMRQFRYPGLKEHRAEHAKFIYDITMFNQKYINQVPTGAKAVNEYMNEWFANHVLKSDLSYRDFKNNYGFSLVGKEKKMVKFLT